VDLIVLPEDGLAEVIGAIKRAKRTIDLIIFRFDLQKVESAIEAAVQRGVAVRAMIAHTNKGGEKRLRSIEQKLLAVGVTVSRTGDDLVRYHGKLMIVDRAELHVHGFNMTSLDLKSRSFGLVARDKKSVQEGLRLFEADVLRQEFEPTFDSFVVSPENAREVLATFIKRAKKSLAVYDPQATDPQMIRLLHQRAKSGVDVRIIGRIGKRGGDLKVQKFPGKRLHVRAMVRDGEVAFVGSQSLRALELDARREVGLLTKDPKVVKRILETFDLDWARTELGAKEEKKGIEEADIAVAAVR
jgi:cardiolipin synthase A/B